MPPLSRRSFRSWKRSTASSRPVALCAICVPPALSLPSCEAECRLKSRRSLRTSSPPKEEGEEREEGEGERARQRWRRAGSAVVQRLSFAGQRPTCAGQEVPAATSAPERAKDAEQELSLPSPSSPSSPSRRSERSEDGPSWPQLETLASERDAARAEKAQMESQSQELEQENTTLRLLLEEEGQRTQALLQQVDYLAELLEEWSCFWSFSLLLCFAPQSVQKFSPKKRSDRLRAAPETC